jgi:O-antigen ligase
MIKSMQTISNYRHTLIDLISGTSGRFYIFLAFLFLFELILLLNVPLSGKMVLAYLFIPAIFSFLFFYKVMSYSYVFVIFISIEAFYLNAAIIYSLPFLFAYLLSEKSQNIEIRTSLLITPLALYYISTLPSLYNSSVRLLSLYLTYNIIGFGIIYVVFAKSVNNYKQIRFFIFGFLTICAINSIVVFIQYALYRGRNFGFEPVVFVDFLGVAIILTFSLIILRKNRRFTIFLMLFFASALFFTQTRNVFIAVMITIAIIGILLLFKKGSVPITRTKLILSSLFFIISVAVFILIFKEVFPGAFNRMSALTDKSSFTVSTFNDIGQNSLATRYLVWLTAFNAFLKHPILGIGVFSFPYSSATYSTLPFLLYNLFVKGLSPHHGYLCVLTETGIIGMIGLILFFIMIFKVGYKAIRLSETPEQQLFSYMLFFTQVYIAVGLFFSDAWFVGQERSLWGICLGLMFANYKIVVNATMKVAH